LGVLSVIEIPLYIYFILLFCQLRTYQEQSFIQDSRVWLTKSVEPKPPKLPFYAGAATASHQEQ
jgi:hypothetical protein